MKQIIKGSIFVFSLLVIFSTSVQAQGRDDERPRRGGPPEFSVVDLDSDGILTLEEFQNEELPYGDHTDLFSVIDADGNGEVSEQEWTDHKPPKRGMNK